MFGVTTVTLTLTITTTLTTITQPVVQHKAVSTNSASQIF